MMPSLSLLSLEDLLIGSSLSLERERETRCLHEGEGGLFLVVYYCQEKNSLHTAYTKPTYRVEYKYAIDLL